MVVLLSSEGRVILTGGMPTSEPELTAQHSQGTEGRSVRVVNTECVTQMSASYSVPGNINSVADWVLLEDGHVCMLHIVYGFLLKK